MYFWHVQFPNFCQSDGSEDTNEVGGGRGRTDGGDATSTAASEKSKDESFWSFEGLKGNMFVYRFQFYFIFEGMILNRQKMGRLF